MNMQVYEEACNWFVDLRAGDVDAAGRRQFDAWIRKSPEHVRAYLEIAELWQDAAQTGFGGGQDLETLLAQVGAEENVVPFAPAVPGSTRAEGNLSARETRATTPIVRRFAVAASLAVVFLGAMLFVRQQWNQTTYSTGTGEQRLIVLADGSAMKLNTRSRVKVQFAERERRIELLEGQALFRVAKDTARPFTVRSGDVQVRAVGTQFDVYRRQVGTTVTVVEGRVVVSSGPAVQMISDASSGQEAPGSVSDMRHSSRTNTALLGAGQQVTVLADAPLKPKQASVEAATAWTQQRLVFKSSPLTELVQEFNRYNRRPLVIGDVQLASFLVSGVYSSTDPSLLLTFLRQQPGIHIEETDTAIIITSAPGAQ